MGDIRAALGRFQFSGEQVTTKLSQLSGGERARVALLKLLLEENNLLFDGPNLPITWTWILRTH